LTGRRAALRRIAAREDRRWRGSRGTVYRGRRKSFYYPEQPVFKRWSKQKMRSIRSIKVSAVLTPVMSLVLTLTTALAMPLPAASEAGPQRGILLLAHGAHAHDGHTHGQVAANPWNDNVEQMAHDLDRHLPTEVAFGMADPETIQQAVQRLEARGIEDIAVVPLFVSSYSPLIGNSRYILGLQPELAKTTSLKHLDRITSHARFRFADAMDAHPLISEILLERARAVADDPARARVILIAHGPNDDGENRLWLRDMEVHARYLREHGGFQSVAVLTHRNDAAAEVKNEARAEFRRQVAAAGKDGRAVVVPVLLSAGGIEAEVQEDLEGLDYRFAQPLMPHPNIERWAEVMADGLFGGAK
jgi:sirohydrochlorin ferrochelatase